MLLVRGPIPVRARDTSCRSRNFTDALSAKSTSRSSRERRPSFTIAAERAYFGGKLVAQLNASYGYLVAAIQDRLGSVGKYYPYGEDRTGQPGSDTVRFATYTRDSATGNDYADQRYYSSVLGRFTTMDRSTTSLSLSNPESWNRYAYVLGDSINSNDPSGLCAAILAGVTMNPSTDPTIAQQQAALGAVAGFPYSGQSLPQSLGAVVSQAVFGPNASTAVALQTLLAALNGTSGSIDVIAYSGGAQAFATALGELSPAQQARIGNILYISPGMLGTLPTPNGTANVTVVEGWNASIDPVAMLGTSIPSGVNVIKTTCDHADLACLLRNSPLAVITADGPCSSQGVFFRHPDPWSGRSFVTSAFNFTGLEVLALIFGDTTPPPPPPPTQPNMIAGFTQ